ncbi:cellulose binding domain-containing protein [Streptosporangium sandarakinum]
MKPAPGTAPAGYVRHSSAAAASAAGCTATVTHVESWPGGYRGAATISNVSGRPMRDWYIQWLLPQGAKLTQAWNGTPMQSGPIAMIHAPEGAVLSPGATVSEVGFVGSAAAPPAFTEITCG